MQQAANIIHAARDVPNGNVVAETDVILGELSSVLLKAKLLKPVRYLLHRGPVLVRPASSQKYSQSPCCSRLLKSAILVTVATPIAQYLMRTSSPLMPSSRVRRSLRLALASLLVGMQQLPLNRDLKSVR